MISDHNWSQFLANEYQLLNEYYNICITLNEKYLL